MLLLHCSYGFVTYDSEEDAQKVIKEAENLIIKHRRLNVSTAVMKHNNGSFGECALTFFVEHSFLIPFFDVDRF